MKLTIRLKLLPSGAQKTVLLQTLEKASAAANAISALAWDHQVFGQFALHGLSYHTIRETTGLSAQMVVRLVAKVSDAYKLDHKDRRVFRKLGAITYDDRILRYRDDHVSIWTVDGRQKIPFTCGPRERELLKSRQGESDLIYQDGNFYLSPIINYIEPPTDDSDEFLGVDLGIVNIATDSDGEVWSGAHLNSLRSRHRRLRKKLQAKGTHGTKRLLKKRRLKESRFATWTNHNISKHLVVKAKGTHRGIALENLKGIRDRVTVSRSQRTTLHSWGFYQLRTFLTYKAKMHGVPLVSVDPHNTSRTCPNCGHIAKENRPNQSTFLCVSCGFAGLADHIAATNIGRRAAVNQPYCPALAS